MYLLHHKNGRFVRWLKNSEINGIRRLRRSGGMLPPDASVIRNLMEEMLDAQLVLVCNCRSPLAARLKVHVRPDGPALAEVSGCGRHDEVCPVASWASPYPHTSDALEIKS